MDPSNKLYVENGDILPNVESYRRLIGKLLHLTITHPNICFAVNKLCQNSSALRTLLLKAVDKVLHYLKEPYVKVCFILLTMTIRSRHFVIHIRHNVRIQDVQSLDDVFIIVIS